MSKLIQLQNGDWINPDFVVFIRVMEKHRSEFGDKIYPPRVMVQCSQQVSVINCDDYEQATEIANEIAGKVNL